MKSKIRKLVLNNTFFFQLFMLFRGIDMYLRNKRFSDEKYLKRQFSKYQDYELDLEQPKTLNEKLQWIKLHDRQEFQVKLADKFTAREFIEKEFGARYLIPLVFHSTQVEDLVPGNFPDYPFALKTNHGFGNTVIVRDKNEVNWKSLRLAYKRYLNTNYYYYEREWQYKSIKPMIIAEKLLLNKDGFLPNDYKLNFIAGKLEFIYVSVDREGNNKRNIYDANWEPLHFTWARKGKDLGNLRGSEIDPPPTLNKMVEFGSRIAKLYKYVRADFYDVDGALYIGEITQCHGGGFDQMLPYEYDLAFGQKISIP